MATKRSIVVLTALLIPTLGFLSSKPVEAQDDSCVDLCSASCIKPWSIPDRWDDVTGIPGYMGGGGTRPDWRYNQHWDHEMFTDANGNGLYDGGESYIDGNANGRYDEEAYHPSLTGYGPKPVPGNYLSPDGDVGLELVLHPGSLWDTPVPGQYQTIDLPPINKGAPIPGADEYRRNMAYCNPALVEPGDWLQIESGSMVGPTNQGMRELIAQDPNAYWDNTTQSVQDSSFPLSPRVVFFAVYDPRLPGNGTGNPLQVVKVVAFFMERMTGTAEVQGRFLRAFAPGVTLGAPCTPGQVGGFIVDCPVPATESTWGRVKATYRN